MTMDTKRTNERENHTSNAFFQSGGVKAERDEYRSGVFVLPWLKRLSHPIFVLFVTFVVILSGLRLRLNRLFFRIVRQRLTTVNVIPTFGS